jgi:hypothetical protein
MKRHTFVVQVHRDGISTLENLSTHERVRVSDLGTVGSQIERWLADQPGDGSRTPAVDTAPARRGSAPGSMP